MLVSVLDSTMRLVGTEQGETARVYRGHTNKQYCSMNTFVMTLPQQQQAVACGSEDGSIWLYDLNSKQVRYVACGGCRLRASVLLIWSEEAVLQELLVCNLLGRPF